MKVVDLVKEMSFREQISWKIVDCLKPLYFFIRKNRKPWNITIEYLKELPEGTLGNDIARFLIKNNLTIMPKAEFHDAYHVLFGYETNIKDEACIQFVPLGNGKYSLPYILTVIISVLLFPEFWPDFVKAYKLGKEANRFYNWDFEQYLNTPTKEVRKLIFEKKGKV